MQDLVPTERFFRRSVLLVLLVAALGAVLVTVLHLRQSNPHPLDLVVPPTIALVMFGLYVYLYRRPDSILQVIWIGVLSMIAAIAVPAWHYTITVWRMPDASLVGTLPPIGPLLLFQLLILIFVLRPQHLLEIAVGTWLLVATPILAYFAAHPQELASPRGLDIVMALGPVALSLVLFIPFQRGVENWISKLQSDHTHARALAERDALTGLYNRRAGERFLADLLDAPHASDVLILFDLDRFKVINDTFGHPAGDAVLKEVAQRCGTLLRKSDIFARWGGEEFFVLIRGTDEVGVIRVANDLRRAISATSIEPVGIVTASFGMARFQVHDTLTSWLKRADEALYEAKTLGRDRVIER